jgi:hypothetical protein
VRDIFTVGFIELERPTHQSDATTMSFRSDANIDDYHLETKTIF